MSAKAERRDAPSEADPGDPGPAPPTAPPGDVLGPLLDIGDITAEVRADGRRAVAFAVVACVVPLLVPFAIAFLVSKARSAMKVWDLLEPRLRADFWMSLALAAVFDVVAVGVLAFWTWALLRSFI